MKIKDILNLVKKSKTPDFGEKNWVYQPKYFESVFKHIDLDNSRDKLFIELGVFAQHTLSLINQNTKDIKVYGFDTFTGLPENWESKDGTILFEKNSFEISPPPNTEKNEFIQGKIENTLQKFLKKKKQKIKFVHLDLDLYGATKYSLNCIYDWLDDESILVLDDVYNFPSWEEFAIKALVDTLDKNKFNIKPIATCGWKNGWASLALKLTKKTKSSVTTNSLPINSPNPQVTIVTGLWDLKRGDIEGWGKRDFKTYKEKFFELLKSPVQMAIFIPEELKEEVIKVRQKYPTKIYTKELREFKLYNPFFSKINEIRKDPKWVNQAGWLAESPQAQLEYYNPMMMSKMFMVNEVATINPFDSEYFYWIDGGLSATVHQGYFNHDDVLNALPAYSKEIDKFVFLQYPYEGNTEIHGFEREKIAEYCKVDFVDRISRGGFWGGKKDYIHQVHGLYYYYLAATLSEGYMGADESLNTILSYRHPELIHNFELEGNGLCWPFFENLKEYLKPTSNINIKEDKTALYVLTFNSPKQFETLIESFKQYDSDYLDLPEKYLINNSTKRGVAREYNKLCKEYGFTQIKKKNIGICGGRQFIAEHFESETDANYYLFFEDDMFFYNGKDLSCKNGFVRKIPNLYQKSLEIMSEENFDFLKLNFTEFYGDNQKQWSWHNVPANTRKELFPENPVKSTNDTNAAPFAKYKNIKSFENIPYATGEVYYCNWPQIVSREGNKKMFLDTKWDYPYEQTWMSFMYQETLKGNLYPGILLTTPTEHDRFEFYPGEERREH